MIKSFGTLKFEEYKKKQQKREQIKEKKLNGSTLNTQKNIKKSSSKGKKSSKKVYSMNEKEEKIRDSWVSGEIKGVELKNFSFNTKDSE